MQSHTFRRAFSRLSSMRYSISLALPLAVLLCSRATLADAPADALEAVADAAAALANDDASGFLDQFESSMPGYATLRAEVEGLLSTREIGSTVDVISNEGDDRKRTLELDWVFMIGAKSPATGGKETRRGVVKCQVEHRGKAWKITAIEPVEFFRP